MQRTFLNRFLGALFQEKFLGPWNRASFLAALKKEWFGKAYKQKIGKIMKMRNNLCEMQKIQQFSKKMIKEYKDAWMKWHENCKI